MFGFLNKLGLKGRPAAQPTQVRMDRVAPEATPSPVRRVASSALQLLGLGKLVGFKRIILHWSAGAHAVSELDREHYHAAVSGTGQIVLGKHPFSANLAPLGKDYAAHTRGANSNSIGVAVCCMAGAVERPFNPGRFPMTDAQLAAFVDLIAVLAIKADIPVTRETILSHAEVERTLGIWQRGKWDITWLPGDRGVSDAIAVGDRLRAMIKARIKEIQG